MSVDVSNKVYHIKDNPYFIDGERIVGDFVSANHTFNEISVDIYEGDLEIWYIDRADSSASVLAYANGTWEIEYRYITFAANTQLSDSDFNAFINAYDEYIEPRTLRNIYQGVTKIGSLSNRMRGSVTYQGQTYPFDNRTRWATPTITLQDSIVSTPYVDGVTKYKVYSNGSYIGYVDANNTWHGEVSE